MSSVLEKMLARTGETREELRERRGATQLGKIFRRRGVVKTKELERIAYLPRRRWQDDPELEQMRRDLTDWLRANGGTQELRLVQAASLQELHDFGGLFGPQRVGAGKTLLSFLAAIVVGAMRPLLLIPSKLVRKTEREFAELARHWLRHPKLAVMSYELLSRDRGTHELIRIAPDLIIGDEVHRLKSKDAGCTRKVRWWMREKPATRFVAISGTITTRSIGEYEHILMWCLPGHPPVPRIWGEIQDWGDALDEKVPEQHRLAPGALLQFCNDDEILEAAFGGENATAAARKGYRRRLTETPGVVATEEGFLGASIQIHGFDVELGPNTAEAFRRLREDWQTPDGWDFSEAVDLWRHAREIACGFFYKWDPPAPKPWLEARKNWKRFAREMLKGHREGIDTEDQVAKACRAGRFDSGALDAWTAIRNTFKPNTVPVWIDDGMVRAAEKWLLEGSGLCWVEHQAFGQRLSEESGVPYFAAQGLSADGTFVEDFKGPAIVSIDANKEGRNLQYTWSRNLIVSCPPNGGIWEQAMGRTHRDGQEADEVTFDVAFACREQWRAFAQAQADAKYIEHTTGQAQKLLYADVDVPTAEEVKARALIDAAWRE